MAEIAKNEKQEHELVMEENEEEENDDSSLLTNTSTSFLTELNLVLILSYLSSSAEECFDPEELKELDYVKDHKARSIALNFPKRTRESNEFRAVDRQAARFQTRVRDCRHCRKM